jgi:hypothetical protein
MCVKRQHMLVNVASLAVLPGLIDKPSEDGVSVLQTLRVPLHTQYAFVFRALHGLDDAVVRAGNDAESGTGVVDSLMVQGVDF